MAGRPRDVAVVRRQPLCDERHRIVGAEAEEAGERLCEDAGIAVAPRVRKRTRSATSGRSLATSPRMVSAAGCPVTTSAMALVARSSGAVSIGLRLGDASRVPPNRVLEEPRKRRDQVGPERRQISLARGALPPPGRASSRHHRNVRHYSSREPTHDRRPCMGPAEHRLRSDCDASPRQHVRSGHEPRRLLRMRISSARSSSSIPKRRTAGNSSRSVRRRDCRDSPTWRAEGACAEARSNAPRTAGWTASTRRRAGRHLDGR